MTGTSVRVAGDVPRDSRRASTSAARSPAAYAFAVAGLNVDNEASLRVTAAVMAAGMAPPLAWALASTVKPGLFTEPERETGRGPLGFWVRRSSPRRHSLRGGRPIAGHPVDDVRRRHRRRSDRRVDVTLKAPTAASSCSSRSTPSWFVATLAVGTSCRPLAIIAVKQFVNPKAEKEANAAFAAA